MKTAVIALTRRGAETALEIGCRMEADTYIKMEYMEKLVCKDRIFLIYPVTQDFSALVAKLFMEYEALVFVMACGIVVRSIAPLIRTKVEDPAVVVVDEAGRHAISLLSGHIGGANQLAGEVAAITGGTPVITTATDVNNVVAFDVFAKENDCSIENIQDLKYISSELVNGGRVGLVSGLDIKGSLPGNIVLNPAPGELKCGVSISSLTEAAPVFEKTLYLRPRNLILGIGCKKGTSCDAISNAVMDFLEKNGRSLYSVRQVASIDLKREEAGILDFCRKQSLEFRTFSAEVIRTIEDNFTASSFVKSKVGVGSVSEACAVLAGRNARLVCPKTVYSGITLALAEEERACYL